MYRQRLSKIAIYGATLTLALGTVLAAPGAAAAQDSPVTTPTGFQAEVGASSVIVTWEPSSSRAGDVVIYFARVAGRSFFSVEPTLTFHLAQDTTYRMEVQAQDAEFNRSDWSEPFFFTTPDEFPVTTPGNVRVTDSPGSATVEWDPSSSDAGVLYYVATVTGGPSGPVSRRTLGATSVTFDLPAGGDLQVTVQARDQAYRYSDRSDPVGFTVESAPGFAPPTAPDNLQVMFDSRGLMQLAAWNASDGTGPITYHLLIDGSEIESTQEVELELFSFVRCTDTSSAEMDLSVKATANGFESSESEPVPVCFP